MSNIGFAEVDQEKEQQVVEAEVVREPEAKSTQLAKPQTSVGGEIDPEDINITPLNVLSSNSQYEVDDASNGDIIFDKETKVAPQGEDCRALLVHTRKYWKENVPFSDKNTVPKYAHTPEERDQLKKITTFDGVIPVCEVVLLLERPDSFTDEEAASQIFIYNFGGKEFALVRYTVQKAQAVRENYGTVNTVVRAAKARGGDVNPLANYFTLRSKKKGAGTPYKWSQFTLSSTNQEAPSGAFDFAESLRGKGTEELEEVE